MYPCFTLHYRSLHAFTLCYQANSLWRCSSFYRTMVLMPMQFTVEETGNWYPSQRVVTYIEAFVTGIKNENCPWLLDRSLSFLDLWWFKGQKYSHASLEKMCWSIDSSCSGFILIPWSAPKMTLIAWFYFHPGHKRFYRQCMCDYPLIS